MLLGVFEGPGGEEIGFAALQAPDRGVGAVLGHRDLVGVLTANAAVANLIAPNILGDARVPGQRDALHGPPGQRKQRGQAAQEQAKPARQFELEEDGRTHGYGNAISLPTLDFPAANVGDAPRGLPVGRAEPLKHRSFRPFSDPMAK